MRCGSNSPIIDSVSIFLDAWSKLSGLTDTNRQIRLAARPSGRRKPTDWELTEEPVPEPADGQFAGRTRSHLARPRDARLDERRRRSYIPPVGIGEVMRAGAVGEVIASKHPGFAVGDHVVGHVRRAEHVRLRRQAA